MRVETDAGEGFLKTLGNPEGPHALASEWVGTRLAELFGLPTLDYALIVVEPQVELPMSNGSTGAPGPAFITRLDVGLSWGGSVEELEIVVNREQFANLVAFDTWVRNRDRHSIVGDKVRRNTDNVWLSKQGLVGKKARLTAIDHTHCFGNSAQLTAALSNISSVQDERVFGFFPEFATYLKKTDLEAACHRLAQISHSEISPIFEMIPFEWEISEPIREAWLQLLEQRATYVSQSLVARIFT
jgi:hypothetical protein